MTTAYETAARELKNELELLQLRLDRAIDATKPDHPAAEQLLGMRENVTNADAWLKAMRAQVPPFQPQSL